MSSFNSFLIVTRRLFRSKNSFCKSVSSFSSSPLNKVTIKDKKQIEVKNRSNHPSEITCTTMNATDDTLLPPQNFRGLKELDPSVLHKTITVPCLVLDSCKLPKLLPVLKNRLLKLRNFKNVYSIDDGGNLKKLYLNPLTIKSLADLSSDNIEDLDVLGIKEDSFCFETVTLTYDNWSSEDLLKALLPEGILFSGWAAIGHIIQVNLKGSLLDYKYVIGRILLDKIPYAKTVLNKLEKIESVYRNLDYEILCGEDNMMTTVKEHYLVYEFDFSKVFWNSRLSTVHGRLVASLKVNDVLFDCTSGVGPFSLPAAKKRCKVFANDLNPDSIKWLNHNVKKNKICTDCIQTFNKDAADFIKEDVKENLLKEWKNNKSCCENVHVTINLPGMSLEFLKYFKHLFSKAEIEEVSLERIQKLLPIINVYFFTKGENTEQLAIDAFEDKSGLKFDNEKYTIEWTRHVSADKDMYKIKYQTPFDYLILDESSQERMLEKEEPPLKKICI